MCERIQNFYPPRGQKFFVPADLRQRYAVFQFLCDVYICIFLSFYRGRFSSNFCIIRAIPATYTFCLPHGPAIFLRHAFPPLRLLHSRFQRFSHQLYLPIFLLPSDCIFSFSDRKQPFQGAMLSKSTKDILYLFSVSTSRSHSTNSRQSFPVYCRHFIRRVFPTEVVLPSIYKT